MTRGIETAGGGGEGVGRGRIVDKMTAVAVAKQDVVVHRKKSISSDG